MELELELELEPCVTAFVRGRTAREAAYDTPVVTRVDDSMGMVETIVQTHGVDKTQVRA